MTDNTNNEVPEIPEITPLPTPPVGMPKVPITLFNVWTWSTPVIPSFYWNVYSAEQRIKQICKEIGRIEAYLDYAAATANEAHLAMANKINEVEQKLSKAIADLTVRLTTEVNRLDDLITAETAAREAGDEKLEAELTKETTERKAADAKLAADLETEVQDREDADETLHTEISAETTARTHADDELHAEISAETTARGEAVSALTTRVAAEESTRQAEDAKLAARIDATNANVQNNASAIITETQAREAADTAINETLATKLVRDDLRSSGKITLTPGEGNTLTIGDSFEADFEALQTSIAGLQAALQSETSERRNDDNELWTAVNQRLERGKLLAGEGIEVQNDPDQSTVTVSAKVTETGLSAVEEKADEAKETAEAARTVAASALISAGAAQSAAEGKLSTVSVGEGLTGDGTAASPVTLATASYDSLGGVKVGEGLTMGWDGKLSVDPFAEILAVEHDHTLSGSGSPRDPLGVAVASQGALTTVANGLAVRAGEGLSISESNQLTAAPATTSTLGGVKVGEGLTVTEDGTLNATGQGGSGLAEVAHDASLSGDGTSGSPLGVNYGSGLTMSGGKLAAQVTKADLTAVAAKADAAQAAADEADSKAEAATEAASTADSKAEAASTAASEAGSKAEAAQSAAEAAQAAAEGKLSAVAVSGPITGDGTTGSPLEVSSATATSAGVITEDRVKELAGSASITAKSPLSVSEGTISLRLQAPLETAGDGALKVKELDSTFGDHDEAGVTSINTIRECFTFNEPLKQEDGGVTLRLRAPLEIYDGALNVKEMDSTFGDHDEAGVVSINTIRKIIEMFIKPEAFKD